MNVRLTHMLAFAILLNGTFAQLHGQTVSRTDARAQETEPLFLHWFKPFYRGNGEPPAHILTLRVTPSTDFEVHFRDPTFKTRKCSVKGSIEEREGEFFGDVECIWKSGTGFTGEFKLDKPHQGRPLGSASTYHHTHVVLSHKRSPESFLQSAGADEPKNGASQPNTIDDGTGSNLDRNDLPFDELVFRSATPDGKRIFHLQINKNGSYVFFDRSGGRPARHQLDQADVKQLVKLVTSFPKSGTALETSSDPVPKHFELVVKRGDGFELYSGTDMFSKPLAPTRQFLERLVARIGSDEKQDASGEEEGPETEMQTIRVIDGDSGKPISGATFMFDPDGQQWKLNLDSSELTAVALSDERGEVQLPVSAIDYLQFRVTHPKYLRSRFARPITIYAGVVFLEKTEWPYGKVDGQTVIRLWRAETLTGKIQFADGKPAAGMPLQVWGTVNDLTWMNKTGEEIRSPLTPDTWVTEVRTMADGRFAIAVPPRAKREAFSVLSTSSLAAPFERRIGGNDVGLIKIPRGVTVRGTMLDADNKPVTKTLVILSPEEWTDAPDRIEGPEFRRLTYTDDNGRFQLALAAPGSHILSPYTCLPQRLELRQDQAVVEIETRVAPTVDLKFSARGSRAGSPGIQNLSLHGEVPADGGKPIPYVTGPFTSDNGTSVAFRVPRAVRNARLHLNNLMYRVVYATDQSGKLIPADSDPLDIADLTAPPNVSIWIGDGTPLQVNILDADGKVARDIEVTGEATGRFGVRMLGAFHREKNQWESPGLYEGEHVTVTVKRGKQSHRATTGPIRLDTTNTVEVDLP